MQESSTYAHVISNSTLKQGMFTMNFSPTHLGAGMVLLNSADLQQCLPFNGESLSCRQVR